MLGVHGGFPGLRGGRITELEWEAVEGWMGDGGAHLGLRRDVPSVEELYAISRALEEHQVDALMVAGGWNAYRAAHLGLAARWAETEFTLVQVHTDAAARRLFGAAAANGHWALSAAWSF